MKKFLLFIILTTASFVTFSQLVTISGINQIPQIGDTIHYTNINAFGFELAGTGTVMDKTWDLSFMTEDDNLYFFYIDPAETPDAESFTTSNLAEGTDQAEGYFYFKTGDYYMARKGVTGEMYIDYANDSATTFTFPITAGHDYDCTYEGMLYASGLEMEIANGDIHIEADAQGTLITPNGSTFTNVLRLHIVESFDGMYDVGTGTPMVVLSVEDDYYYWFHEDYTSPILIYGVTTTESLGSNPEETEVLRYQPIDNSSAVHGNTTQAMHVFPNPSSGLIFIANSSNYTTYNISDLNGKLLKTIDASFEIDLSEFNNGIYFIEMIGATRRDYQRIVITR